MWLHGLTFIYGIYCIQTVLYFVALYCNVTQCIQLPYIFDPDMGCLYFAHPVTRPDFPQPSLELVILNPHLNLINFDDNFLEFWSEFQKSGPTVF